MSQHLESPPAQAVAARALSLRAAHESEIACRTDRLFAALLGLEWVAAVVIALAVSPRTWEGGTSSPHLHVGAALGLGALLFAPPAALASLRPGRTATRHVVAIAQMLMGALLIHVTGGRIETHFHIFGSLAFLAFYRDYRVLLTATAVVLFDHLSRGIFAPLSIYGVSAIDPLRWLEHGVWVIFEDVFLIASCVQGQREMSVIAERQARVEAQGAARAGLRRGQRRERGGPRREPREERVSREHEPRDPDPDDRGDRLRGPAPGPDAQRDRTVEPHPDDPAQRRAPPVVAQRHPRHLEDRGREDGRRAGCLLTERRARRRRLADAGAGHREEPVVRGRVPDPDPETIQTDPTRLRQVLMNLVGNAIKFTERGGVSVLARCDDHTLSFEVADTGVGMTAEQLGSIFQPFAQGDSSTTRRFGGSGLGLVISRRLAEMLGGDVTVQSLARRGSSFTLTLPTGDLAGVRLLAGLTEAAMAEVGPAPLAPSQVVHDLGGVTILLAEDGLDNQILIATYLRKAGAHVTVAENGRIAVARAQAAVLAKAPFDLILMDMQMPELDGYGATSTLRAHGYVGPIVALTAHAMAGDRERCIAAGCSDYLTKPINPARLLGTVSAHTARRGGEPSLATTLGPRVRAAGPLISDLANDGELIDLVRGFVNNLPERWRAVEAALNAGDKLEVKRLAHQLKGSAGSYGFGVITTTAGELELSIQRHAPDDEIRAITDGLTDLCQRARATGTTLPPAAMS